MSSVSASVTFKHEVNTIIWNECAIMLNAESKAIGIAFDDPSPSRQYQIWISYVHNHSFFTYKERVCDGALWTDLFFAMRIMERLWKIAGEHDVVKFIRDALGHQRLIVLIKRDKDGSLATFEQILHRTDDAFSLLEQPLT